MSGVTSDRALPGDLDLTIESTAEAVTAAGGRGVPICCDVTSDQAIKEAVAQVGEAEGRLDLLCCSAYTTPPDALRANFWEQGTQMWDYTNGVGLRQLYATCVEATPLLIETAQKESTSTPLIVLVSSFGGSSYTFNVAYGVGKAATDRLARDMAIELAPFGVATTSIYPGLVRTEGNMELERLGLWEEASGGLDLALGETAAFSGRAVNALAGLSRAELLERSGRVQVVAELAKEFDFLEADGSRPPSIRSLAFLLPNYAFPQMEAGGLRIPAWVRSSVPDVLLPWSIFSSGPPPVAPDDEARV